MNKSVGILEPPRLWSAIKIIIYNTALLLFFICIRKVICTHNGLIDVTNIPEERPYVI